MKKYLKPGQIPGLAALLFAGALEAQISSDLGRISADEYALKKCSFDPDAPAIILLDEAFSNYDDEYRLITDRHVRIKILDQKGIEYANIKIPYYSEGDFESISNIEAIVVNQDASTGAKSMLTLDRKLVYDKKVDKYHSEKSFSFPGVQVGSILEYRYKSIQKNYAGLDYWYFQNELPTVKSVYAVIIIPNYEFAYQVQKSDRYPISIQSVKEDGKIIFSMQNVAGLRSEPYMDSPMDYLQKVKFQLSASGSGVNKIKYNNSWDQLMRDLLGNKYLGGQLNDRLSGTEEFIKLTLLNPSPVERMKIVYNYVRANMNWNGIYSRYSPDGIKNAWSKKTGTSGECNLILINLLKAVDLDAYAMLVSERFHGKVNKDYPFEDQFNTEYALVIIDGKRYYLNATNKYCPPRIIPYDILNTTAFVLDKKAGGLINIADTAFIYSDRASSAIKVAEDGSISGEFNLVSENYARVDRLASYKKDIDKYISQNFRQAAANATVSDFELENEENDSLPLKEHFSFTIPASGTGDYIFIPLNLFSDFTSNPFISDNRFTNVNFGYRQQFSYNYYIDVPESFTADALPKSQAITNPDRSITFSRQVMQDKETRKILVRLRINIDKSLFTADEYPNLQVFYKKMFDLMSEQIALKKNSKP